MAQEIINLNDPEDVQRWSSKLNREAIHKTLFLRRFAGEGKNWPIQIHDELNNNAGSTIKFFLRMKASGRGRGGDDTLEGHEEVMTRYNDSLIIDQLRHAVDAGGRMSAQRITFDNRAEARDSLSDWWAERLDTWFANILVGNTTETDTYYTGMQAPSAATTVRRATGDAADETTNADSAAIIAPADIDWMVNKAQIMSPAIRPVNIDGVDHYILVIHPNALRTMRDSSGEFHAVWKSAMEGGKYSDNPIISGSTMVWNNVVIYVNSRLPQGIHSSTGAYQTSTRTGIFMGAQAAGLAFGRGYGKNRFSWVEELVDYRNRFSVAAGLIAGAKKLVYNSADHGVIKYLSYAPDPA